MQPDLRCYHHPEREATSQCDRCGDYLCAECVTEFREQYLCATCLKEVRPRDTSRDNLNNAGVLNMMACVASPFAPLALLLYLGGLIFLLYDKAACWKTRLGHSLMAFCMGGAAYAVVLSRWGFGWPSMTVAVVTLAAALYYWAVALRTEQWHRDLYVSTIAAPAAAMTLLLLILIGAFRVP